MTTNIQKFLHHILLRILAMVISVVKLELIYIFS